MSCVLTLIIRFLVPLFVQEHMTDTEKKLSEERQNRRKAEAGRAALQDDYDSLDAQYKKLQAQAHKEVRIYI